MRYNIVVGLFLILIVSIHAVSIHQATAPPVSYGYTCGLVSALDTDIHVSYATVNAAIIPDSADGENLTHSIEVSSSYNITNTADHGVSFLTSYVRSSWTPQNTYSSVPKNVTIECNSSLYNASIVYNISTKAELPEGIGSRYPSDLFSSFIDPRIDVINITMAAHAELVLLVQTSLFVNCYGNYFDFRFGLDMEKLRSDSTQLDGRFDVSNTSLLVKTDFLNSNSRSVNQVGDSLVATWSISDWNWDSETPYPGLQIDYDVFSDYIGVQLWQSEYFPPTIGHGLPGRWDLVLFLAIPVITVFILLAVWSRRGK
ncbi:MAG: hypothetical protein KGD60_12590 [Candidatus Thorarchaeota archaeon]|nr:hypothetical protein [Candidatus Thorarchaeota archaeon]